MRTGPNFYRGHPDASWKLETTLERYLGPNIKVSAYYAIIADIQSRIETFTDRDWDLSDWYGNLSLDDLVSLPKESMPLFSGGVIDYMQYLRHFGFPSPLLDWTLSPYVAAYYIRDVSNKAISSNLWFFDGERIVETTKVYPHMKVLLCIHLEYFRLPLILEKTKDIILDRKCLYYMYWRKSRKGKWNLLQQSWRPLYCWWWQRRWWAIWWANNKICYSC